MQVELVFSGTIAEEHLLSGGTDWGMIRRARAPFFEDVRRKNEKNEPTPWIHQCTMGRPR